MKIKVNNRNWMKLCLSALIPLMIGVFTIVTTIQQQKLSTLQREQDKEEALLLRQQSEYQTDNLHKEKMYSIYLDDVSNLLISDNDKSSLTQIRAKTLATLRQLDSERKKHLLLFLYDSELIFRPLEKTISSLLNVNDADFSGVYFQGTTETSCSFMYLYLYHVYLSNSSFIDCYIDRSNFSASTMYRTNFFKARLYRISFKFTLLHKSNFNQATLFNMDFVGASLVECNFTDAFWKYRVVDFRNANLTGAVISDQQLSKSILDNSILPNGTWGPIQTKNLVVNGGAEQNKNVTVSSTNVTGWHISTPGVVSIIAYDNQNSTAKFGKYYFRVTPFYSIITGVSMSQNISLENFTLLISAGVARYDASINFQCSGNQFGYFELMFIDLNGLTYPLVSQKTKTKTQMEHLTISKVIHPESRRVRLRVSFVKDVEYININNTTVEENYCIADNVEFSIMKEN